MSDETHQQPTNIAPARAGGSVPIGPPPPPPSPPLPAAKAPSRFARISNFRFALAMGVAVLADTVGLPFGEVGVFVFDLFIGLMLALCLRGFKPEIVIACLLEAIPGIGLFPSWTLAVPALWARMRLGQGKSVAPEEPGQPR